MKEHVNLHYDNKNILSADTVLEVDPITLTFVHLSMSIYRRKIEDRIENVTTVANHKQETMSTSIIESNKTIWIFLLHLECFTLCEASAH